MWMNLYNIKSFSKCFPISPFPLYSYFSIVALSTRSSFLFRSMHTFDVTGLVTELPMLTQYAYAPVPVEPRNLGVYWKVVSL